MSTASIQPKSLIYTEVTDDLSEPTQDEIEEYAKRIGIDVEKEPFLLYLAREGIQAKLPSSWSPCLDTAKNCFYYFNKETLKSQWEHPMDPIYRDKVVRARGDLALSRPPTLQPLNMRLPPVRKSGAGLAPINRPSMNSLGSLGGFGPTADLPPKGPSAPNSSSLTKHNSTNSKNIIGSSMLSSFKDYTEDDVDDESPPPMRTQKKSGLTLTGGGANFLKGTSQTTAASTFGKLSEPISSVNSKGLREVSHDADDDLGGGDSDRRPTKSILVNSISRSRHPQPSDNVYELDGFSMNLEEMNEDEKLVLSQLDSASSRSRGNNVKFNLEENTELKFEMPDDEEDDNSKDNEESEEKVNTDTEEEEEDSPIIVGLGQGHGRTSNTTNQVDRSHFQTTNSLNRQQQDYRNQNPVPFVSEYSGNDITAMKDAMRKGMEEELKKFKEQLEEERKSRQEQIQKHMEETMLQFKAEKDETLKNLKKEIEGEKTQEMDKAKREIDSLLQKELENMKTKYEESLQQRQKELQDENDRKIEALAKEFEKRQRENETKRVSTATSTPRPKVISRSVSTEEQINLTGINQDAKTSTGKSNSSPSSPKKGESKEQSEKQIRQAEADYTAYHINALKDSMRKEMEDELKRFKEQLELERKSRQEQIQNHMEGTMAQFKREKDETLKKMKKDLEVEKMTEMEKAKREIDSLLQKELEEMKQRFEDALEKRQRELREENKKEIDLLLQKELEEIKKKFDETLQQRKKELEEENKKKMKALTSKYRKKEEEKLFELSKQQQQDLLGSSGEQMSEDTHQRIVEDAKAFIQLQKNRLKDPSPIPNSSHLILPTTKNSLLMLDEKLLKSGSPRRSISNPLDLVSDTESSGVSSLKDHRSSESKKLSRDIDDICNSLNNLDQQMKLMWSVVKGEQPENDSVSFLNPTASNTNIGGFKTYLPNTVPLVLGKSGSGRVSASLPASARKPLVPSPSPITVSRPFGTLGSKTERYSNLLSSSKNTSSSQTVLDALRMSGMSTTRLDCTELLQSLEDELKEFKTAKQKILDNIQSNGALPTSKSREKINTMVPATSSAVKLNNQNNSILEKTKDLQEWLKKY